MNKYFYTIISIILAYSGLAQNFNQHRYSNKIFTEADTSKSIEYATAPWLNNLISIPELADYNIHEGETTTENRPLFMDIYTPKNDTVTKRPAIIFVHGGAFLLGTRHNEDMVALCDSFAKMGYVTASIEYRLGVGATVNRVMGIISSISVDEDNFSRSVYRGIQDGKAAVRYLKQNALTYGVDTNMVYMVGSSAGGFVALHNIYMDKANEIPNAATQSPDLGGLDAIGANGYESQAKAIVPFWGAIQNTSLIESNQTPALLVHGTADDTVPFKKGIPLNGIVPPNPLLSFSLPETYGSYCIDTALTSQGINHESYFVEGEKHEFYGVDNGDFSAEGPNEYWGIVFNKTSNFLFKQHKPTADFSVSKNDLSITLTNESTNSNYFKWTFGDSNESNDFEPTHTYTTAGTFTIQLIVQNNHYAWDTISKTIEIEEEDSEQLLTFTVKDNSEFIENAKVTLAGYGSKLTGTDGKVEFEDVAPENDIKYTVTATNYNEINDSVSVFDQDVNEIVILTKSTYEVLFTVKADGTIKEGANVTLGDYGTKTTDVNGIAKFANILPSDSIYYEVSAELYSSQSGKITVVDDNISKIINLVQEKYKVTFVVQHGNDPVIGAEVSFGSYGKQSTNMNGISVFDDVLPGIGLEYIVRIAGFSDYLGAINVYNEDVVEYVTYSKPSYSVLFIISAQGQPLAGANVTLGNYGNQVADNFGYARFINVAAEENIDYSITADGYPDFEGKVTVVDKDIEEVISITNTITNELIDLEIFPNPTHSFIYINAQKTGNIELIDVNGKTMYIKNDAEKETTINVENFSRGIYFLKYTTEKLSRVEKVIKN